MNKYIKIQSINFVLHDFRCIVHIAFVNKFSANYLDSDEMCPLSEETSRCMKINGLTGRLQGELRYNFDFPVASI